MNEDTKKILIELGFARGLATAIAIALRRGHTDLSGELHTLLCSMLADDLAHLNYKERIKVYEESREAAQ